MRRNISSSHQMASAASATVACIATAAILFAQPASSAWSQGDVGVANNGHNMTSFSMKTNTTVECYNACIANAACKAWQMTVRYVHNSSCTINEYCDRRPSKVEIEVVGTRHSDPTTLDSVSHDSLSRRFPPAFAAPLHAQRAVQRFARSNLAMVGTGSPWRAR